MKTHAHLFFLGAFALTLLVCFTQVLLVVVLAYGHTVYLQLLLHIIAHTLENIMAQSSQHRHRHWYVVQK